MEYKGLPIKKIEFFSVRGSGKSKTIKKLDVAYVTENFDLVDKITEDDFRNFYGVPSGKEIPPELLKNATKVYLAIHRMNQENMPSNFGCIEKAMEGILDKKEVSHLLDFLEDWIKIYWEYGPTYGGRAGSLARVDYWDTKPKNHEIGKLDSILKDYAKKKSS